MGENKSKRLFLYFIGLNMTAAVVVSNIRYDLRMTVSSSVMYAISEIYRASLGIASIICYSLFVLLQCILSKKATLTYLLEVPLSFAFGFLTDLCDTFIMDIEYHIFLCTALFITTMFAVAMGVCSCVKTDLVLTPADGTVRTISEALVAVFPTVEGASDISLALVSVFLCSVNHIELHGIGIGTILSALFLGRIIKMYERFLYPVNKKLIGK